MGKKLSYVFLAILAAMGLGSAFQMQSAADIIDQANTDTARYKAEMKHRDRTTDDEIARSRDGAIDPAPVTESANDYGKPTTE